MLFSKKKFNIFLFIIASLLFSLLFNNCNRNFNASSSVLLPISSNDDSGSPSNAPPVPINLDQLIDAPASLELEDWSSGSAKLVGRINLNKKMNDLVFEDNEIQQQMGQVMILNSDQSIKWAGFEFGGIAFISQNLAEGNTPLFQVLFGAKPFGRWQTYPFADTFNAAADVTIPPPFKVIIRNKLDKVLGKIEMSDGKAINDPSLSQSRTLDKPLRPFFNCAMLLPWVNKRSKESTIMTKLFPGFKLPEETQAKVMFASNGAIPLLDIGANGRQQVNGINHWFYLPQWPMSSSATSNLDLNNDPYLANVDNIYTGSGSYEKAARATGWDYEPGSISGHDWFTGPGGVRFDRAMMPAPLAYLLSNKNYIRLKDNRPIREMVESWGKAYFNHSNNYLTDVKNFSTILNTEAERLSSSQMYSYYGRGPFSSLSKSIDMRAISNGDYRESAGNGGTPDSFFLDKNGNRFWGGYSIDDQHSYQSPYWHTLLLNSPMHLVAARSAFNQSFLSRLGGHNMAIRSTTDWGPNLSYTGLNQRTQAFRWFHYTLMWKMGTQHSLGVSRAQVLKHFIDDLHYYYDQVVVPIQNENKNPYHVAVKKLGMPAEPYQDYQTGKWTLRVGTAIGYYHSTVFVMMKTFGLWTELRQDPKAKLALDFAFNTLSKYSIDFILDTDGRAEDPEGTVIVAGPVNTFEELTAASIANSWKDWSNKYPTTGKENWIKNNTGQIVNEKYAAQHIRAQWAIMVRDWFPEMNYPRAVQAAAMYEAFYAEKKAFVDAQSNSIQKVNSDWFYKIIGYSAIKNSSEASKR